ncbi:hypothetical protein TrRE_jg12641 [Triparma retinervis]|uniref:Uncharacterized protein n=1 Tax=Triparma retinervis TaxID=2557542 RepID=A0A9W7FH57_9STRA|nr:hypothetical protein TrRE_jg12641 [Triparma retinervis]
MRNSFLLSYPSVPSAAHPELARLLERNSTDMTALNRLKKLNDILTSVNNTVEQKVGPSNGNNANSYNIVVREELKKAVVADPNAMQIDPSGGSVTAVSPAVPAPPLPPPESPVDPFPHFFSVPESSLASLPTYLSSDVTPLRRHLLSRLSKRLLRCSGLLTTSNQPNNTFANPPDWCFVPLEPISEKTKRVLYEPWRGAQLTPGPTYTLPPHKSLFAPQSVYDYKEHLNYCINFLNDQKNDFLNPPHSQHLRDNMVRGKPVVADVEGTRVFDAEKGELDRIVKKLKESLDKKTMSKKDWQDNMREVARKYAEGRGV